MAQTEETHQSAPQDDPAQPQPVASRTLTEPIGDDAITIYKGLTLGSIVQSHDALMKWANEAKPALAGLEKSNEEKNAQLLRQSDRIVELETALAAAQSKVATLTAAAEESKAKPVPARNTAEFERCADGSLRVMVRVPEEQAIPLLSWAEGAGEDPQKYVQTVLEDALVSVVSS